MEGIILYLSRDVSQYVVQAVLSTTVTCMCVHEDRDLFVCKQSFSLCPEEPTFCSSFKHPPSHLLHNFPS